VQVGKVAVALVEVEAVADEELVGDREAHVAHRQVLDESPVGPVEQRRRGQRRRVAERQGLAEVVEGKARVDDILDDDDVAAGDLRVEVLQQADPGMSAGVGAGGVAGELDEVEPVVDRERARQVRDEDEARLQRSYEQRLEALVVAREVTPQLADARPQLLTGEVDLAEPGVGAYEASSSRYRSARRSMSRL